MQNQDPGRCAWCALETLGRTHGWTKLNGLVEKNARGAYRNDMISELKAHKVKYEVNWPENKKTFYYLMHETDEKSAYPYAIFQTKYEAKKMLKDLKILGRWWIEDREHWDISFIKKSLEENLGCTASLDYKGADEKYNHTRHMVVIVGVDDKEVRIVDSNYEQGKIRKMPLTDFLDRYNGFSIKILKRVD